MMLKRTSSRVSSEVIVICSQNLAINHVATTRSRKWPNESLHFSLQAHTIPINNHTALKSHSFHKKCDSLSPIKFLLINRFKAIERTFINSDDLTRFQGGCLGQELPVHCEPYPELKSNDFLFHYCWCRSKLDHT